MPFRQGAWCEVSCTTPRAAGMCRMLPRLASALRERACYRADVDIFPQTWSALCAAVAALPDEAFDEQRRVHWGATMPLWEIVVMSASHWVYHAGEMNAVVAIVRGHAWEYTEEVEENHIATAGHRLRPQWMSAEQAAKYEAFRAARDRALHGGRTSP